MDEETALANPEMRLLKGFIRDARVSTEFTKSDFAYIAIGNKDRPAEVQTPNGNILRGDAVLFYGKYPKPTNLIPK